MEDFNTHTLKHTKTHTHRCREGLLRGTGFNTPLCQKRRERKRRRDQVCIMCTHPAAQKQQHSGECVCVPSLAFVTPWGSPRSRADPLSLSCPLFMHSFPLFFFIHSLLVPSLSFSAALNGPLFLRWVTDEWTSSLKSRVTARAGQAWRDARTKEEAEEWEGRKEGKGRREGGYSARENVKQRTSIKSARDGGWMCVWWGSRDVCMSASEYLHCGAQHAKIKNQTSRTKEVTPTWRSDIFLEADPRSLRREVWGLPKGPECLQLFFYRYGHGGQTDCLWSWFIWQFPPDLMTLGGFLVVSKRCRHCFGFCKWLSFLSLTLAFLLCVFVFTVSFQYVSP